MSGIHHLDLVVSDLERSLRFYRELLAPLGYEGESTITGEHRYALGLHHVAFDAASREVVDERARWLAQQDVEAESGPEEYDYKPGYYAVFFRDPDGLKLEIVHSR